jgi:hypothetical protein
MQNPFANFSLTLINTRKNQYLTLGWCTLVLNMAVSAYAAFLLGPQQAKPLLTLGLVGPLLASALSRFVFKKKESNEQLIARALLLMTAAWLMTGIYWAAAALLLLLLLFKLSVRSLVVTVCEQGISYPSVPKKLIDWNKISNVIVKDGLLTIDLRSNQLIQQPIEKNSFIDEQELLAFNAHCQAQINLP